MYKNLSLELNAALFEFDATLSRATLGVLCDNYFPHDNRSSTATIAQPSVIWKEITLNVSENKCRVTHVHQELTGTCL